VLLCFSPYSGGDFYVFCASVDGDIAAAALCRYLVFQRTDQAAACLADVMPSVHGGSDGDASTPDAVQVGKLGGVGGEEGDDKFKGSIEQDMFDALRWAIAQNQPSFVENITRMVRACARACMSVRAYTFTCILSVKDSDR